MNAPKDIGYSQTLVLGENIKNISLSHAPYLKRRGTHPGLKSRRRLIPHPSSLLLTYLRLFMSDYLVGWAVPT